jgi:hypothetical protein
VAVIALVLTVGGGGDQPTASPRRSTTTTGLDTTVTSSDRPVVHRLEPSSANASSVLDPQVLRCTGETASYEPTRAIDGSDQTAWATAEPDGAGQQITVEFPTWVHLTKVGLSPGYTKVGSTTASGCEPHSRFFENRIVTSVRYVFDNGSAVTQDFRADPSIQRIAVDVDTRAVTIEIVATTLPSGPHVDDNTLISELEFEGYEMD